MTHAMKPSSRRLAFPAAVLAVLLLAGCSTGHIGESWQCPLAEGGTCDSVAAADPAVPAAAGRAVLAEPLWRVRTAQPDTPPAREPAPHAVRGPGRAAAAPCPADCGEGFDPFAWLARVLGGGDDEERTAAAETKPGAAADTAPELPPATANAIVEPDAVPPSPGLPNASSGPEDRSAAFLPAVRGAAPHGPDAEELRTDEVVARIWIAPFVDADGVYREAGHVRVVLEPAGWRLK